MRVLVVSDLHGDLDSAIRARTQFQPDLVLSCGDSGRPGTGCRGRLAAFDRCRPVLRHSEITIRSNSSREPEQSGRFAGSRWTPGPVIGNSRRLRLAAIGGIMAKSHAKAALCDRCRCCPIPRPGSNGGGAGRHPDDAWLPNRPGRLRLTSDATAASDVFFNAFQDRSLLGFTFCGHLHVAQDIHSMTAARLSTSAATLAGSRRRRGISIPGRRATIQTPGWNNCRLVDRHVVWATRSVTASIRRGSIDPTRARSRGRTPRGRACRPHRWCGRCRSRSSSAGHPRCGGGSAPRSAGGGT